MTHTSEAPPWRLPMVARNRDEQHRASTPLELLFDLCFVVGVSQAAGRLHHALGEQEIAHGVGSYLMVFFAIWWAWVNFTWFASAYDNDDVPYRLITMVQIAGALTLAAGIPRAFDRKDFTVVVIGYVVIRLAMVTQWLRAAVDDPERRTTSLRFAIGITAVQVGWILRLWLPDNLALAGFLILVVGELAVPIWAEHAAHTTWHRTHIAERYGLFTLIVLGEAILASTAAIQSAFDAGGHRGALLGLTASGLVVVFAMWWLYFDRDAEEVLQTVRSAFFFGYFHYFVFASAAAVGAGIALNVDAVVSVTEMSSQAAAWAIGIPIAVYILSVWLVHRVPVDGINKSTAFPIAAALVLLAPLTRHGLPVMAALLVLLVVVTSRHWSTTRSMDPTIDGH
jgi:low temperature requirement protein LtrA